MKLEPPPMNTDEKINVHKGLYEQIYQSHGIRDEDSFYRWILDLLQVQKNKKILDVACCHWILLRESIQRYLEAHGADISQIACEKAKQLAPTSYVISGNAEKLSYPSSTFDYVTCLGSIENMVNSELALQEIHRVLIVNGKACIVVPNRFWFGDIFQIAFLGKDETPCFQPVEKVASLQQWRKWISSRGFKILDTHRYNKPAKLFSRRFKLRSIRKFIYWNFINKLCPFSLSWSFVFICQKSNDQTDTTEKKGVLWEAIS